jgi:DnaJ-class molecular chaperone
MMNVKKIINSKDIGKLGSIEELAIVINTFMQPFSANINTNNDLIDAIKFIKNNINFSDKIFCSKSKEYLFYLINLEGEQRNKLLGITDTHYEDKAEATKWYHEIAKHVHPDQNTDKKANIAFDILTKIYNTMIDEDYNE